MFGKNATLMKNTSGMEVHMFKKLAIFYVLFASICYGNCDHMALRQKANVTKETEDILQDITKQTKFSLADGYLYFTLTTKPLYNLFKQYDNLTSEEKKCLTSEIKGTTKDIYVNFCVASYFLYDIETTKEYMIQNDFENWVRKDFKTIEEAVEYLTNITTPSEQDRGVETLDDYEKYCRSKLVICPNSGEVLEYEYKDIEDRQIPQITRMQRSRERRLEYEEIHGM